MVVDVIFPPLSPFIHDVLLTVPIVKDVFGALRLRVFFIAGGSLSGDYAGGQWGDGFLGTTSRASAHK
jgi:hypothetical protein